MPFNGLESLNRSIPASGSTFFDTNIGGKRLGRGARFMFAVHDAVKETAPNRTGLFIIKRRNRPNTLRNASFYIRSSIFSGFSASGVN